MFIKSEYTINKVKRKAQIEKIDSVLIFDQVLRYPEYIQNSYKSTNNKTIQMFFNGPDLIDTSQN
jgi:hypothetical protein